MCIICKEYVKGNLTVAEVERAIGEMVGSGENQIPFEHLNQIDQLVKADKDEQDPTS